MRRQVGVRARRATAVALALLLGGSLLALPGRAATSGSVSCASLRGDAIHRRTLAELAAFARWLRRNHVRGMVGEFGWPDNAQGDGAEWDCMAQDYYAALDRYSLPAVVWTATEMSTTNKLAAYHSLAPDLTMSVANEQAAIIEAHPSTARYLRGVSYSGSEACFMQTKGPSPCTANVHPGAYGVDYNYPSASGLDYLASRGVRLLVLPIRWERIQPALYQPLNQTELSYVRSTLQAAKAAGLTVMVDLHNFGGYWETVSGNQVLYPLGSPGLPVSALVDVWRRLSAAFHGYGNVMYRIMNEPIWVNGPTFDAKAAVWRAASQAVVSAIRAAHDRTWLVVDGYNWSMSLAWSVVNPRAWIHDRTGRIFYDMHQYFDLDHSSRYALTYDQEDQQLGS